MTLFSQKYSNNIRTVTGTPQLYNDDVVLECDTTLAPVVINLQEIPENKWNTLWKLYIVDKSGNSAVNNITINAGSTQTINGQASITLAVNNGVALIRIVDNGKFIASFNFQGTPPPVVTSIPVKNTAFVMKNGDDSTGLIERFDKPFLTINGAINALDTAYPVSGGRNNANRCLVKVETGNYSEDVIYKEYIDIDLGDSFINGSFSDNFATFSANPNGYYTNKIYGNAIIFNTKSAPQVEIAFQMSSPNAKVLLIADKIGCQNSDTMSISNGNLKIIANDIFTLSTTVQYRSAIELIQGYYVANYVYSKVEVHGANIYNAVTSNGAVISFNHGGALKNQELQLINCRLKNAVPAGTTENMSVITAGQVVASDAKVSLYNTILYSTNGNSLFALPANTINLFNYHSNMSNKATGGGGTINVNVNAITVDPAVEAGF